MGIISDGQIQIAIESLWAVWFLYPMNWFAPCVSMGFDLKNHKYPQSSHILKGISLKLMVIVWFCAATQRITYAPCCHDRSLLDVDERFD